MAEFILAAGAGLALFDLLSSTGQKETVSNTILTDMSISSTYQSNTTCVSSLSGAQAINIEPGPGYKPALQLGAPGSSCLLCQDALQTITHMRNDLEQAAVDASLGRYQAQTASEEVADAMIGGPVEDLKIIGACDLMCKDVVVFGVQQSQVFQATENCKVSTEVKDTITQSIQGKIKSALKNQEDILGSLEDAFTSNTEAITNSLSSRMSETLTSSVQQTLVNNAVSVQKFNLGISNTSQTGGAHSVYVNSVLQSFTSNSVASLNVNNQVNNSLRQSADYSIAQQLLNKNDTIGDITKDFLGVINTMGGFMDTLTGDLLIIIGAMLAMFVAIVGISYFASSKARALIDNITVAKVEQYSKRK